MAFGGGVDYAALNKTYAPGLPAVDAKLQPTCLRQGVEGIVSGNPEIEITPRWGRCADGTVNLHEFAGHEMEAGVTDFLWSMEDIAVMSETNA
jgi:hypothetical protein